MDILKKIEMHAKRQSNKIAFLSGKGEISYGELWEKSGRLASAIDHIMSDNRKPVVVYGHKDPMVIVCFLACVKSGRAYCPVDINTPPKRITQIIEKIGEPLVLVAEDLMHNEELKEQAGFKDKKMILGYDVIDDLSRGGSIASNLRPCMYEDDYYIIFTSGTTGKPKGVRITTNNLNNYLEWAVSLAGGIEERSVFLNQAPYSFDLSVMDLYLSLSTGGTVVSVDSNLQKDAPGLLEFIRTQNINYWVSTPSFVDMCLADKSFDKSLLPEMKAFLFCGEVLSKRTAQNLIRRFPDTDIINTYGPTESTVCVTEILITEEMATGMEALPVGRVKPGTEIQIDPDTSEIIIIGDTVSPGYYKDECLTKDFFTYSLLYKPLGRTDKHPEERQDAIRAYRTGDKGHFDKNGLLYCDGRIDNQIKLHGYRIEIEDVESNLSTIPGVDRAAVAPKINGEKIESLTAFVVRDKSVISDDYIGRKTVRMALREKMPSYMVPKRIVFLEKLPITNNGKIDRHKLREMA